MKGATMMDGDNPDPFAVPLAELLSASIQIRMMFQSFRKHLVEDALPEFLALEQRLLDVEIQLRQLNIAHPILAAATSEPSARTLH
jgi:hypothetical protein